MLKPIRCVRFTEAVLRHADTREQNPSLGMLCPGEPQRSSIAPKLRIGLRRRQSGKRKVPVKQRGSWPKVFQNYRRKTKHHSSHLRKIGAYLQLNLRNETLLSTPERRCT